MDDLRWQIGFQVTGNSCLNRRLALEVWVRIGTLTFRRLQTWGSYQLILKKMKGEDPRKDWGR